MIWLERLKTFKVEEPENSRFFVALCVLYRCRLKYEKLIGVGKTKFKNTLINC